MKIEVFPSSGQWFVRFRNKGRTLLTSEGYKRRGAAERMAYSVRENAIEATVDILDGNGKVV